MICDERRSQLHMRVRKIIHVCVLFPSSASPWISGSFPFFQRSQFWTRTPPPRVDGLGYESKRKERPHSVE